MGKLGNMRLRKVTRQKTMMELARCVPTGPDRIAQAVALQRRLAKEAKQRRLTGLVRLVGGADVAFSKDGKRCVSAVVVMDYRKLLINSKMHRLNLNMIAPFY